MLSIQNSRLVDIALQVTGILVGIISIFLITPYSRRLVDRWRMRGDYIPDIYNICKIRKLTIEDCNNVSYMANDNLGEGRGVSSLTIQNWISKNDSIFIVAECKKSKKIKLCGFYSLVPLNDDARDDIKNGRVQDYDIESSDILSWTDPDLKEIYIMDLMTNIKRCRKKCRRYVATALILHMRSFIKKIKKNNTSIKRIFTVTASKRGEELAQQFGFCEKEYKSPFNWKLWERPASK